MTDSYELKKMQLIASLNAVAESMRNAASMAESFAQMVKDTNPNPSAHHTPVDKPVPSPATGSKRKASTEDEPDGPAKKKRVPRKKKDPNAPKRPASSYLMFQNDIRKELKSQHPDLKASELLALISKQWSEMTNEQKSVYTSAMASAKEKYTAEKAAYEANGVPGHDLLSAVATPVTPAPLKKPKVTHTPITPAVVASSTSGSDEGSSSEESSEGEGNEEDEEEEEEEERPAQTPSSKKVKKAHAPDRVTPAPKRQK